MKKMWQVLSRKELIFLSAILVAMLFLTTFETKNKIVVDVKESAIEVVSKRYSMSIPMDQIISVDMVDPPEFGELVDGFEDMTIGSGTWKNDKWGEYQLCAIPFVNCIVVCLEDGQTYVFNRLNDQETVSIYEMIQRYIK